MEENQISQNPNENSKNNQNESQELKYIYESPDKGKTIYRRVFGQPHNTRELISNG